MFPKLSFDTFLPPRHQGGLSILDPSTQQLGLQLRWIIPLYYPSHKNHSFIHPWFLHLLADLCSPHDILLYLLFSSLRPPSFSRTTSLWGLIGRTLDITPRDPSKLHPFLQLLPSFPLTSIISNPHDSSVSINFHRLHLYKTTVADAYYWLLASFFLDRRPRSSISHRNILLEFFRLVDAKLYTLHPFFLRYVDISQASPLSVHSSIQALLHSLSFPTTLVKVSSHIFCTTVITNVLRNPHTPFIEPLEARQWRRFLAEPILPQVRNIGYRALHQSLSCKVNLHAILPHLHPFNLCTLCNSNSPDTMIHFLHAYPIKWDIWCFLWSDLFLFTPTIEDVHSAIFFLSFPHIQSRVRSHTIVACILHGIWRAHWRLIFDVVPFDKNIISHNIHHLLSHSYSLLTYEPP